MSERVLLLLDEDNEPEKLVIDGEFYDWNGSFFIPLDVLKSLSIEDLPLGINIEPYTKMVDDAIYPLEDGFSLVRTDEGIEIQVNRHEYSKYWNHPVVSLSCYMEEMMSELDDSSEFEIIHYEDDDEVHFDYAFSAKLTGVETIEEGIKLGLISVKSLERSVRKRIARKVMTWAEDSA